MKYVYKKGETSNIEKTKGHYKNSLRKKRSVDSQNDQTAPLIVNYETSHAPIQRREQWLPANVIANSNLANFNIETLHDNVDVKKPVNDEIQSHNDDRSEEDTSEHKEIQKDIKDISDHLKENGNNGDNKDSSEEKEELSKDKSQEEVFSNESEAQSSEEQSRENDHRNYASKENDDRTKDIEINEHHDDKMAGINSKLKKVRTESEESEPRDKEIQDVDLNDFGYERIQLDKKGQVESVSEPEENDENPANTKSRYKTKDESNYSSDEKSDSSSIETNEPTHINDGEVKPVVELNLEADSFEFNEDNPNSKIENESLEELTGVKDDISENNDRLQEVKEPGDIKQQFERVPLNYKHKKEKQAETKDKEGQDSERKNDSSEIGDPKGVKYDENLNIKFGDLDIKLPEIKLPDDVLSYAYEESPNYRNEKPKKNFYKYKSAEEEDSDDEEEENGNEHDDSVEHNDYHNDADNSYYDGYHGHKKKQPYTKHKNENENKAQEEEEDEDPYEKFVRERFGKRGNFEQRSQKLQNFEPHDPQLYKTVQKVIEKTKNLNKEAAKSGDPNAGYMWTLEYGQKL